MAVLLAHLAHFLFLLAVQVAILEVSALAATVAEVAVLEEAVEATVAEVAVLEDIAVVAAMGQI